MPVNFTIFNEVFVLYFLKSKINKNEGTYLLKFFSADELVIFAWLDDWFFGSGCVTHFFLENSFVFLEDLLDQGVFANARWANKNEWLSSEWSRVERMEVLFSVNIDIILQKLQLWKNTYGFVQKNTAQEIVEHLTDLWVALHIFFMGLNKLVFTDREILKHLVIKVYFAKVKWLTAIVFHTL